MQHVLIIPVRNMTPVDRIYDADTKRKYHTVSVRNCSVYGIHAQALTRPKPGGNQA